jgi:hypothetical protein
MFENKKVIYADNVAIVQSQDCNSPLFHTISTKDFFKFTGDITGTIEIRPKEAYGKNNKDQLQRLFGAWVENGDEEIKLEDLYKSRILPSFIPEEEE